MQADSGDGARLHLVDAIVKVGGNVGRLKSHLYTLPLREALEVFAQAAPRVPRQREFLRYGRDVVRVPEAGLDAWYTQAWWGTVASGACENRLIDAAREQEVIDLVLPVDWSPLDTLLARGKGVLIAATHSGVPFITSVLLTRAGRPPAAVALWYTRHRHPEVPLPPKGTKAAFTEVYLKAFQRLRAGGIASVTPDGRHWREATETTFFGHPCHVSLAAAALTRLTGAPALPMMALWEGHRIRIEFGAAQEPEAGDGEAADRLWVRKHLDWLEGMLRAHPRAIRFTQMLPGVTLPSEGVHVAG